MKFKVGDRVKLIKTEKDVNTDYVTYKHDKGLLNQNQTGIVSGTGQGLYPIRVKFEGHEEDCGNCVFYEYQLQKIGEEVSMKNAKYGVKYEENEDPVEFFKTKKEAEERVKELLDETDVEKNEIYMFEVGKKWKVERPINYDLVEI